MTKPMAISDGLELDLAAADRELRTSDAYRRDGHTARTLVREPVMQIVLVAMRAGAKIAQHRSQETASIHAIEGEVRLALPAHTVVLAPGRLLVLAPGLAHDVEAMTDSAFLLTLARGAQS